ncbi:MAG: InlB B-repeat-containing protein, partial [Candidatus Methanomethylophilaceae archaeon]|nr:InlB B-repeat-containing protein [Candidatus Methanomethylophilaceae archaeon]
LYPILAVATNIVLTAEGDSIFRANTPSSDGIGVRSANGKTLTITLQPGESWRPSALYNGGNLQHAYFIDDQSNILLRSTTFYPSEDGGNLGYTVVWRDTQSYLKLNANGGEITQEKSFTGAQWCGNIIKLTGNAAATYGGYTFDGWYTAQSGGTLLPLAGFVYTKEMRDSMSTVVIEGKTYYQMFAHWKGHISYQTFEGTYTGSSESYPVVYTPSSGYVEIGGVSKPGYTFGGWYYDEQYQTPLSLKEGHDDIWLMDTTKVSPCTLYAKWVALPEIDITFLDDDQEIVPSITILPDRPTIFDQAPISVPAGKAFDGWTATLQGSETLIPLGTTASISLDDCTLDPDTQRYTIDLQAHYTEKFYVIVYELDGGSFKNKPRYEFLSTDTFTIAQPIKTGYQFTGWLGTITDSVQYNVKVEACAQDVTLVALWVPIHFDVGVTYVDQVEGTTGETSDKVAATYSPVVSYETNGYLAVSYKTSIHYDISVTAENAVLFDQGNNSYIFSNATAGVLITITISDPNVPSTDEPDVFYIAAVVVDGNGTSSLSDDFYKFGAKIAAESGYVLTAGTITVTCSYYVDEEDEGESVKVYGSKDIEVEFDGTAGTYYFALDVGEIPYWAKAVYGTTSTLGVLISDLETDP